MATSLSVCVHVCVSAHVCVCVVCHRSIVPMGFAYLSLIPYLLISYFFPPIFLFLVVLNKLLPFECCPSWMDSGGLSLAGSDCQHFLQRCSLHCRVLHTLKWGYWYFICQWNWTGLWSEFLLSLCGLIFLKTSVCVNGRKDACESGLLFNQYQCMLVCVLEIL